MGMKMGLPFKGNMGSPFFKKNVAKNIRRGPRGTWVPL